MTRLTVAALLVLAPASALAADAQFAGQLEGAEVMRHTVPVSPGTTWTFKLKAQGAEPHLFVSTEPVFQPHDAACADVDRCTVDIENIDQVYVFVMSGEGEMSYRLKGRSAASTARR